MNIINMYFDSTDIQPEVLLRHFLRYLGFYINEVTEPSQEDLKESIADIYVISNAYIKKKKLSLALKNAYKSILVLKDGWKVSNEEVESVYCNGHTDKELKNVLLGVAKALGKITGGNSTKTLFLSGNIEFIKQLIEEYISKNILQASLFSRCFYKQPKLYKMAYRNYYNFISCLEALTGTSFDSDLLRYALIYSKYELNIICKNNSYSYSYPIVELREECENLLKKYMENEELHLLKADIKLELEENWLQACDDYANSYVQHCAYAGYKRGKIFRSYLEEYDIAEFILKEAINQSQNYAYAWYQLGECYEGNGSYYKAINAFLKIYNILEEKLKKSLMSPKEFEYVYKAIMKIAAIYKTRLGDYTAAHMYDDFAERIKKTEAIKKYLDLVGSNEMKKSGLDETINQTIKKYVDLKLEKIY